MMLIAPVVLFLSSSLLLRFYDWNSGGTGEGAGYGAAFLGLITLANGVLILVTGIIRWLFTLSQKVK